MQEMKQLILILLQKMITGPYCCGKGKCNTTVFKRKRWLCHVYTHTDRKIFSYMGIGKPSGNIMFQTLVTIFLRKI